jgi:hypothetical protein
MLKRLFSVDAELRYTEATATLATRWPGRVGTQWIVRDTAPVACPTAQLTRLAGLSLVATQSIEGVGSCTETFWYLWCLLPQSADAAVRFNRSLSKLATSGLDSARRSKLDLVISGKGPNG